MGILNQRWGSEALRGDSRLSGEGGLLGALTKTLARDIRSYWVGVQGVYVPRSLETIPWPPGTYRRFHLGVERTRPVYSSRRIINRPKPVMFW